MAHMGHPMPVQAGANTKGSWKKLLNYCKKYLAVILIALLCAMCGVVTTIAGPDKLADITDLITEGIAPDTDALEEISAAMTENLQTNMQTLSKTLAKSAQSLSDSTAMSQRAAALMTGDELSVSDKKALQDAMSSMKNPADAETAMANLPAAIKNALLDPVTIGGITLSGSDQLAALDTLSQLSNANAADAASAMSALPESVQQVLYTDITIDGTTITGADQRQMTEAMEKLDASDSEAMLAALDELPKSVSDLIKPPLDLERISDIAIFLVCLYVAGSLLSTIQGFIMATVTQRVTRSLRKDISEKINRLPMRYYHTHSTGDVLSRVTNDVDMIGMTLNMSIGSLVTAITMFFGSLFMMFKTNVIMSITGILATIIGFALMFVIMSHSRKYFLLQQQNLGTLEGHIEETYTGHTVVKAYNGEEAATDTFMEMNGALRTSAFRAQALSGLMMPIMAFIGNFGYVAVCVVGAALVMNNQISFGVIVSFMMYIRFFTQPLSQIAQATQSLQSAGAASFRVFEFLEAEEMSDESAKPKLDDMAKGDVTFSHVSFGYEPNQRIIKDFSCDVKAGQKIAIVGPTGAGKTTLVNLLMRFYEINGGDITIDNVSTAAMRREDVHAQFCMVLQDTWLFEGTIRENLIYCSKNISDDTMHAACASVGLDHFIRTLPHGYDTVLNDQVSLSQGQKQQMTIARAIIADKPILILDEATSSIDTRTELKIQQAMDKLMEGRTSFVIAHRLSTIKNADCILVLRDGNIVESGTHDELLAKNGFYADLYNSQFEQSA